MPTALGLKRTWKLVVPPGATVLAGCVMTLKSAAFAPDNVAKLSVNERRTEVLDGEGARDRSRGKIGAPKVGVVRATWACIAVNDSRPIAQDIDLGTSGLPAPTEGRER